MRLLSDPESLRYCPARETQAITDRQIQRQASSDRKESVTSNALCPFRSSKGLCRYLEIGTDQLILRDGRYGPTPADHIPTYRPTPAGYLLF